MLWHVSGTLFLFTAEQSCGVLADHSVPIPSSIDGHLVISTILAVTIMLLWVFMDTFLQGHIFASLESVPRGGIN